QNYIEANNYIIDFQGLLGDKLLYQWIRIDCLGKLGLNAEANAALEGFRAKSRMRKGLRRCIEGLLGLENGSDYERNYRLNETYFGKKGIKTGTYDQVNLK